MTNTVVAPLTFAGNTGSLASASCIAVTTIFSYLPTSAVFNSPQVVENYEMGGFYSQLTGKWYPASRQRTDGYGRLVGDDEVTTAPDYWGQW